MIGTSTPRPRDLADHLGDGRGRLVRVDRDPHELRAGVGQAGDLDRRRVGVDRVGVGHRLDDDRMGAADEHTADVDAHRRTPPRPQQVGRTHGLPGDPPPRLRMMSKPVTQMMKANRNTKPTT